MPDFNKGDFTQQGVAGHVNANLRLNEKRLVNIDMTSNEEAEGCTITGTVKDLLNDKVYNIGSGGGGGGDSDFTTAQVTIVSNSIVNAAVGYEVYDSEGMSAIVPYTSFDTEPHTRTVPLFKGMAAWGLISPYSDNITVSGDIQMQEGVLLITGDGTITYES